MISALLRQKQEDQEFKASYILSFSKGKKKKKKKTRTTKEASKLNVLMCV